ncbi:MAG: hypothetical protein K2G53_05985 [Muribaculaceae bacterium]|nr:hypothetical protein [Muribaculaceae bacterium]
MLNSVKERLIAFLEYKGINKSEFGRRIGVSNAFVTSMRKSIQPDKIALIQKEFPDLNTSWLLTGEGEMLKDVSVHQTSYGDHSPNVNGDGNTIQGETSIERTLDEIAEYRKLLERTLAMIEKRDAQIEKRDAQIDHLIALLENKK